MRESKICSICGLNSATLTISINGNVMCVCQDCADLKLEEETPSDQVIIDILEENTEIKFTQHCSDLLTNYKTKLKNYIQSLKNLQDNLMEQLAIEIERNIEILQEDIIEVDYKLRQITSDSAILTDIENLNIEDVKLENILKKPQKLMNLQVDRFKAELSSIVKFSSHKIDDLSTQKLMQRYESVSKPRRLKSENPIINPKISSPIPTFPPNYTGLPISEHSIELNLPECKLPDHLPPPKLSDISHPTLHKQPDINRILYFPITKSRNILIYDPELNTMQERPVQISHEFPNYFRICTLTSGNLFLCGGRSNFSEENRLDLKYLHAAYIIRLPSFTTEYLPHMISAREDHAIVQYGSSVYVFGGYNGKLLSSVEEFNLNTKKWEAQPEMSKSISRFNVCVYKEKIFIPGIGMFDPVAKDYEVMYMGDMLLYVPVWKDDKIYVAAKANTKLCINHLKIECLKYEKQLVSWGSLAISKERVYFFKENCSEVYLMNLQSRDVSCILSY